MNDTANPARPASKNNVAQCGVCHSPVKLSLTNLEGYKIGQFYDIYECEVCRTSFCDPLEVDSEIYRDIYRCSETLPGYNRYHAYFNAVKGQADPLKFLAEQENSYWFIENYLRKYVDKENSKLLEVGSGLGYLTYSLNKAGYNVDGVELSSVAVEEATKKFGALYRCENALALANTSERFDVILIVEVIEHLVQPVVFLQELTKLLNPGGCILVTTPNKGYATKKLSSWATDLPPIHLWWFTKDALSKIAETAGLSISFPSFRDWNIKNFPRKLRNSVKPTNFTPKLKADGNPIRPKRRTLKSKSIAKRFKNFINHALLSHTVDMDDAVTIGAVFQLKS